MVIKSRYSISIPNLDVLSYLFDKCPENVEKPLFVNANDASQRVTKNELEVLVKKFGKGLKAKAKIENGDVVLACCANSIWFPMAFLATICAGGIFTGANPGYTPTELLQQLRTSGAKAIITDEQTIPLILKVVVDHGIPLSSVVVLSNEKTLAEQHGLTSLNDALSYGELEWGKHRSDRPNQTIACLNFSSGTTGLPKGCMVSHQNLIANCEQYLHLERMAEERQKDVSLTLDEIHCAYVPLYHAMGLFSFCVLNVKKATTSYIMPSFTLPSLLETIHRYRVTNLSLVPPVAVMLIKSPDRKKYDISSITSVICGAAPLGKETSLALEKIFLPNVVHTRQGWGMSEATCAVTLFAPDEYDPEHKGVGYLCPNIEARIVNDEGQEVGYGEVGEAVIRGPNVFQGYWKNTLATRESMTDDGWLSTGDYVVVRSDGLLSVIDRKKELIKVKGFQVAPSELEAHLLECEHVLDCAVIRVIWDGKEHPQAHVVPSSSNVTEKQIRDFMDARLSAHKRLTGGIIFTATIPKAPSGKILRRLIKDPFKETAGRRARL